MADLYMATTAIATPDASFLRRLAIVKMNSRPMLAVEGLIREIVTADADIVSKTHLTGSSRPKRCDKNRKAEHQRRNRPSGGSEVMKVMQRFPLCAGGGRDRAIAMARK